MCDCPSCTAFKETLEICDQNNLSPDDVTSMALELMKTAILYQLSLAAEEKSFVKRTSMQ